MGRHKPRKCRICKKSPVWRGGDVKNPGPYCKRCYHKHVWAGGKGPGRPAASDEVAERAGGPSIGGSEQWPELEMIYGGPIVRDLNDGVPEFTDDDAMVPF